MNKQRLRIAIITGLYAPFLSGISIGVHQRVKWLLQQGHEVFLIHPGVNELYSQEIFKRSIPGIEEVQSFSNFSSYTYPTQPLIFYKSLPVPLHYSYWNDTKLLLNFEPDIVVVEEAPQMIGYYSFFFQGYGRLIGSEYAKLTGTPTITLFHTDIIAYIKYYLGDLFFCLISPIIPTLIKHFSEAYDVNYFSSQEQLARYRKMKLQRGEYLPYQGVDCNKFHPQNICYDPIPDDHRPTLLFVGRISAEKNVSLLLQAYPLIAARIPDVHLVMVGSGPLYSKIQRHAQKFGSGITMWGESYGKQLLGWFARADVFVNPSVSENFCTTNNEALASGTPVVAALAPSTAEQVTPGYNGFLAEPNNPKDFAQKVITILENPDLKAKMTQQARPSILKFDWSACMEKFEDKLYQHINSRLPRFARTADSIRQDDSRKYHNK
ncbi:glycosyltransferase [Nostoc sp. CENA67]|uniref:Glycosyltransferase n=1 Tax=Amazonocrinis nigriterrae CENA67 TaxID=2794033 RepID=A0A8J7HN04_9NOST|nr:glycosyltransferase [Amazonocrinis nigriterrae]MBH8561375.1 glycosyltransferase [Amazonocrinis nigriterrae CENA67]